MHLERFFEKRGWQPPSWLSRWSYYVQLPDYQRAFSSIVWSLYFLRVQVSDASTPAHLVNQLRELMPSSQTKANHLLVEYQKAFYSNYQPDVVEMQKLGKEIFKETIIHKIKKWFITENPEEYSPIS